MRLIDADELKKKICNECIMPAWCKVLVYTVIDDACDIAPTVEAVRHGKWDYIGTDKKGNVFRCSQCCSRIGLERETDYCPNCGAKMDGGEYDG